MLSALIAGGLSLVSGLGARASAKSQQKRQAANDLIANQINKARTDEVNSINKDLGKRLLREKEVTTEKGTVVTENEQSERTRIDTTQDNYSYVDVDSMMQAAEDAGFNPVTWLNAGGMQAYTQTGSRGSTTAQTDSYSKNTVTTDMTTTRKGHNAAAAYALMSPESALVTASQATNIPSVAEAVGKAGQAAFDVYRQDLNKQQSQDFQREMLNLQLDAIAKAKGNPNSTVNRTISNGTPSYSTSGGTSTTGGAASVRGGLSSDGGASSTGVLKLGDPAEASNPFSAYPWWHIDRRNPDAGGALTTRYGEAVEMIGGVAVLAGDAAEAYKRNFGNKPGAATVVDVIRKHGPGWAQEAYEHGVKQDLNAAKRSYQDLQRWFQQNGLTGPSFQMD